jgi:hypothetical protein
MKTTQSFLVFLDLNSHLKNGIITITADSNNPDSITNVKRSLSEFSPE